MKKLRVLVVEDSLTVRRRLVEVLAADPAIEIVGEAEDGQRAIELCDALRPDVMTLDMVMPGMSGVAVTEYVMAHCPTPILVVSSSFNRGDVFKTFDALAAGAIDVLEKPDGADPSGAWEQRLLSTVKLVSRIKVITHPRGRLAGLAPHGSRPAPPAAEPVLPRPRAVALGASTGGPNALAVVLSALPKKLSAPVLVVLHIDEPFGAAFCEWLGEQSRQRVAYARHGESLGSEGRVLMAPPGLHLRIRNGACELDHGPMRHSCRPSIDTLFESLAAELRSDVVAALLTGMGRDGARGLLAIRDAGGETIAQDERTSVIYGMPREAALLGAAKRVLPLQEIGPALAALMEPRASRKGRRM